jgi:NitT/TauT family transport system substrate-binding protein
MPRIRTRAAFVLLAALCALSPVRGDSQAMQKIRVLTTPSESGSQVYYAIELGYFRRAGIDVEIAALGNGAPVAAAVASGSVDIGQGNVVSIATGRQRGVPFVILAPASTYTNSAPTSALIVPTDSPVKTAKDLVGKVIGNSGTKDIGEIAADSWLDANGVHPSSVRFTEVPLAAMTEALSRGQIQAGVLIEPFLSVALANGFRVLGRAYGAIANTFIIAAYFTNADWAKAHPELARKFGEAILASAKWANDPAHHAESAQIIEKYTKVHVPSGATRVRYAEVLDPAMMQPVIDAAARYKAMPESIPATALLMQ